MASTCDAALVTVVIDLDGVIWLGSDPISGGSGAIASLRQAGERIVFLTNNSMPTRLQLLGKLARMGIDCGDDELINSPQAAATLLDQGERVLIVGGQGVVEAVERAGCEAVPAGKRLVRAVAGTGGDPEVAAVIVGLDLRFDYLRMSEASAAVRSGARFIATNDDSTYPVAGGVTPGGGSIVAAISTAAGAEPVIAGKPHDTVIKLLKHLIGEVGLVIGDRASTDGALARRLGAKFALVTSGVTGASGAAETRADFVGADIAEVVGRVLA